MRRIATFGIAVALAFAPASLAKAQGIPVIDTAAIAQMFTDFEQELRDYAAQLEQLQALREQIATGLEQLQELEEQVTAITGSRGLSALLNGDFERAARLTLDRQVNSVIRDVGLGNFAAMNEGRLSVTVDAEMIAGEVLGTVGLSVTEIDRLSRSVDRGDWGTAAQASTGVVLSVMAQDAHERAGETVGALEQMVDTIDLMDDIKGSTDLNTRVTAELGFALVELIRLEATRASAEGQLAVIAAADRQAQSQRFVFGTAPVGGAGGGDAAGGDGAGE